MFLYHGTTESSLADIQKDGIHPREERESQWSKFPSRSDMVYLTTAYPFYFAHGTRKVEDARLCAIEIDSNRLSPWRFHPDEDFITLVLMKRKKMSLDRAHGVVQKRFAKFQGHWKDSIKGLGNVAYRGVISPKAITRICLFDAQTRPNLWLAFADPTITLTNYSICGARYRGMVEWMFGHRDKLPQADQPFDLPTMDCLDACAGPGTVTYRIELLKRAQNIVEHWTKESADRTGIEVLERKGDTWQPIEGESDATHER